LVYGGENEHREYLSDVVIFDLKTAHWKQPEIHGPVPKGRARHSAVVYEDKLFIVGGLSGETNYILDDICYLDLKTWTWSRTWSFVCRFDHTAWIWGGRLWVFGGLGPDMERGGEIWWLDLKGNPSFGISNAQSVVETPVTVPRAGQNAPSPFSQSQPLALSVSGYSRIGTTHSRTPNSGNPIAPGAISSLKFLSGPYVPSQASGAHFHVYSSGALLDFVTPAGTIRASDCSLSSLELDSLRWQRLADGLEVFDPGYRWQYLIMNEDGTRAWLLGSSVDPPAGAGSNFEEQLSEVLPIDLKRYGLLGNNMITEQNSEQSRILASERHTLTLPSSLGADFASVFDQKEELGASADFTITANADDQYLSDEETTAGATSSAIQSIDSAPVSTSVPIRVHKIILQARWPHFRRLYAAQMAEFHTKRMHIPEPYSVVRAFLYYLYTDSIARHPEYCADLTDVAGMLVMANMYDMPKLRLLCVHRLSRELDVEHAAIIWERAGRTNEEWLKRRAASFCLTHWGRVVRTEGFKNLSRTSLMELCEAVDTEGRVVGGEELEVVGGLGGGRFGVGGVSRDGRRRRLGLSGGQNTEELSDVDADEEDGMEMS
jgi:hypothetical protein